MDMYFYSQYEEDELWLIKETEWVKELQGIRESQFSLGNGYVGARGVLEEIPYDATPGVYIAGVYDKMASQVAELVNLPNPFNFKFTVRGEKLGVVAMDVVRHKRVLNLKKGLLLRHTLYESSKKSRFDYHSLRFLSMDNKNIGVMQIVLTSLDENCEVDISTGIDVSVCNSGVLTEGRKRHFRVKELTQQKNAGHIVVETLEKKHLVVYWAGFYYQKDGKKIFARDNIFRLKLKKNHPVIFTKIFYIERTFPKKSLSSYKSYKKNSFRKFYKVFHTDFGTLIDRHVRAWERLWEKADVVIEGTADLQRNLRFNIYHMLICACNNNGLSSVGARTLSGEGYRGHVFWDAEVFLMPFYLFVMPQVARNMLLYRYLRLPKAKELAQNAGFKGAMFPWESADTGEEETPTWAKDIDGSIVRIYTHKMEHHITADIAYAVYKYFTVTGDRTFMEKYGYEIIFECARFWASRAEPDSQNRYHIKRVIGPDEFHISVDDNAYTNLMAKFNLSVAYRLLSALKKKSPRLAGRIMQRLGLTLKEAKTWKRIASSLYISVRKDGLIEQFKGYFKLKKISWDRTDENGIPIVSRKLKSKDFSKTQLIKQADVLMLLYLLSDVFSAEKKRKNYDFYIKRVLHKSSLSPSIHAAMACECGYLQQAYNLFNLSLRTDISNIYGNTSEGIHAACLGGTWQTVIFGFGGVSFKKGKIFINPRMPHTWRKMVFSLLVKGDVIKLELTNSLIKLRVISKKKASIEIGIFGKLIRIKPNKSYTFKRGILFVKPKDYYY